MTTTAMAKRPKPSSSDSDEDAPEKKKSRTTTTKQANGKPSTITRKRGAKTPAVSAAANNSTTETANSSGAIIAAKSSNKVNGGNGSAASFLKSARLTKSQPPTASDTTEQTTNAPVASESDTKKNDLPSQDLDSGTSRWKSGIILSVCLFAANLASAAYIISQRTYHNLAQMRCASTVNKLQLELSDTKEEMKLLRKAIETLEGGYANANALLEDSEGMNTMFGTKMSTKDHKQFLTNDAIVKWQQSLNALEEERLSTMKDFHEKLKTLL